jgi:hypothetical protein
MKTTIQKQLHAQSLLISLVPSRDNLGGIVFDKYSEGNLTSDSLERVATVGFHLGIC